jgi:Ca-activated chloride channel family protein
LSSLKAEPPAAPATQPTTQPVKKIEINLDKAVAIDMPKVDAELSATEFKTADGRSGWALRIPGGRPIATPAYADGKLFVGGGYGSHEFYAFDAKTGKVVWQIKTADDGPTAAVVESGCVAFNTESCTVIVVEATTGRLLWQEWLGDPLMSQPAIANGKLYIAYPGGAPRGVQLNGAAPPQAQKVGPAKAAGHRLLCCDLQTGKHLWEQDITSDVISAPVIEGDQVLLTCFDGTSFCLNAGNGEVVWKRQHGGTSAPLMAQGKVIVTEKSTGGGQVKEGLKRLDSSKGESEDKTLLAAGDASYLKAGAGGNVGLNASAQAVADSAVGFGGGAPASAQMQLASKNVNVSTVAGGWAYQGSRAAYAGGNILNGQGNRLNCLRAEDGVLAWQAEARGAGIDGDSQLFCPPALGKDCLYVSGLQGHMLCVDQKSGAVRFAYTTNLPMSFQPALAEGNLYAGTNNGMLICLRTGQSDADGWNAWGGNAQHNKKF